MYVFSARIGYSQLDANERLSPAALLDLFQDACSLYHEDIGSGLSWQAKQGVTWVVNRWRISLLQPLPRIGETVTVETWPYERTLALFRRGFLLKNADGVLLATGDSLWTLCDRHSFRPVPSAAAQLGIPMEQHPALLQELPAKPSVPAEQTVLPVFPVNRTLLDPNHHVNNVRSLALCMDFLPEDFLFSAFLADYRRELPSGALVTPKFSRTDGGWTVSLCVEDHPCVNIEFLR